MAILRIAVSGSSLWLAATVAFWPAAAQALEMSHTLLHAEINTTRTDTERLDLDRVDGAVGGRIGLIVRRGPIGGEFGYFGSELDRELGNRTQHGLFVNGMVAPWGYDVPVTPLLSVGGGYVRTSSSVQARSGPFFEIGLALLVPIGEQGWGLRMDYRRMRQSGEDGFAGSNKLLDWSLGLGLETPLF